MLRQKPANEAAISRLINFLNDSWLTLKSDKIKKYNFTELMESHGVAKRTFSDCRALGLIKIEAGKKPEWINKEEPSRHMALRILDYRLKKTKKQVHYPIPDFAAIGESLKEITDRLIYLSVQNEKWLKTHKNYENSNVSESDLFRVDDQRLYLAGQIASGVFSNEAILNYSPEQFEIINKNIVTITDGLILKLKE